MIALMSRLFRQLRPRKLTWIETAELQRRLAADASIVLIDVRQPEEFITPPGHLPGAINVPLAELSAHTADLVARQSPVIIVCKTDWRSTRAATDLLAAGLTDVTVLRDGTDGWLRHGLALE